MKITKLFSSPTSGTSGISQNGVISVDEPLLINGRTAYRKTYYIRFELDEHANGLRIKSDSSELSAQFSPYSVQLTQANSKFQEGGWQSEEDDSLVKVRLNHPWRVTKVKTNDTRGIDIFRLDGDALGTEPTIKANSNTSINAEFVAKDFALRKVAVYPFSELSTPVEVQNNTVQKKAIADGKLAIGSSPADHVSLEHDDFSIAMEEFGIGQVPPHGIHWVRLVSYPTGPRIMLGSVNQEISEESSPTSWLMESGEFVGSAISLSASDPKSFWQQLQTSIDRHIESTQSESEASLSGFYIPLSIESDTPCKFKFTDLEINYSLIKNQWDHWDSKQKDAGKEAVSFSGNTLEEHALTLNLPLSAQIEKAIIKIEHNIKSPSGFDTGQLGTDLQQARGVMLNQGTKASVCLNLDEATSVNRVAIAVMGIDETVKGIVKLVADQNDKPEGRELNIGQFEFTSEQKRHWIFIDLEREAILDLGKYWLEITSSEGRMLWLADSAPGKVLVQNGGRSLIQSINPLAELGHALNAKIYSGLEQPLNISLKFNGNHLAFSDTELDITSAVESDVPSEIRIVSGEATQASVYGPEIEYS